MRTYTRFATETTKQLLEILVDEHTSVDSYRGAMVALGTRLAETITASFPPSPDLPICVVCTAEDADYLARGVLEGLEQAGVEPERLKLACFWNERIPAFDGGDRDAFDLAPVVKRYTEGIDATAAMLIVVKSIISSACVVKTNLAELVDRSIPKDVIIAAPVMREGAEKRLGSEFPAGMSERFRYVSYAIDDQISADGNVVIPGIGGSVYQRLGLTDVLRNVPEVVRSRRERLAA